MKVESFIARRYLFSKKSHNAINIISGISVVGVAVATMALVCTLSVFNGFQDLVSSLFTAFDPQLRVTLAEGKNLSADDAALQQLQKSPLVEIYTPVLEDQALIVVNNSQVVVNIKGVADNFQQQADIDGILYGEGHFCLHADVLEYGILGIRLAANLGLPASFPDPLPVYAPRKGERVNLNNPMSSFNKGELQSPGVVFMVKQGKYDDHYILTSLKFAQRLFEQNGRISGVELRLKDGVSLPKAKKEIKKILGKRFLVQDRYEQQEDVFRIMKIEKLISYLFLTFILLVACFNIIGSLSMLMIDKQQDVKTLRSMGASDPMICRIFMLEGRFISLSGAIIGIILGLALCWAQQTFGLISMGNAEGCFIVDSYPVSVEAADVLLIFITVLVVGWMAIWFPVRYLSRNLL